MKAPVFSTRRQAQNCPAKTTYGFCLWVSCTGRICPRISPLGYWEVEMFRYSFPRFKSAISSTLRLTDPKYEAICPVPTATSKLRGLRLATTFVELACLLTGPSMAMEQAGVFSEGKKTSGEQGR